MKKLVSFFLLVLFLFSAENLMAQYDAFKRIAQIPVPSIEPSGFGNMVSGVDLDKDGKLEIYAVNNNWADVGEELIPKIFKFEQNGANWDQVWTATLNIPLQNTWPTLAVADLDKDGKEEVVWGPVNNLNATTNPNPPRIIVFEANPGEEALGVYDTTKKAYRPNAQWTMTSTAMDNQRPFKWVIADPDADGTSEIIFASRAGTLGFGIVSVSNIPDKGDTTETWTMEFSGTVKTAAYDIAVINNVVYVVQQDGVVIPVRYADGKWTKHTPVANVIPGGSYRSVSVVDLNKDGNKEMVFGSWTTGKNYVYLVEVANDTVFTTTKIANLPLNSATGKITGGAAGDLDNDGLMDFVFGSRAAKPHNMIFRMRYNGGAIKDSTSYEVSVMDQTEYDDGRYGLINVVNLDADKNMEVVYTNEIDGLTPLTILDYYISYPTPGKMNIISGKNRASGSQPSYLGADTERGMAFARMGGQDLVFVVSRNGANHKIWYHDAVTGDTLGSLAAPLPKVGLFPVNAAASSEDGVLFVSNMTLDATNVANPFTVYRWDSLKAAPKAVISYTSTEAARLGDMISVYGKASDNTLTIYAGMSAKNKVVKFTTADNGNTFTPEVITLTGAVVSTAPNVAQVKDGTFWYKSYTKPLVHYTATGTPIDSISTNVVPANVTNIKYAEDNGKKYILGYYPDVVGGKGLEYGVIVDVTNPKRPFLFQYTPSLGGTKNGNGTGAVDHSLVVKGTDTLHMVYVWGTNNGLGIFSSGKIDQLLTPEAIADVKIDNNSDFVPDRLNKTVVTKGVVISPTYDAKGSYYISDGQNGINLYRQTQLKNTLKLGDEVLVAGTLVTFNGLAEIKPFNDTVYVKSTGNALPAPQEISIAEFNQNGEKYEGSLIRISKLTKADTTLWPAETKEALVKYTDGTDTLAVYFDKDTDIDGSKEPSLKAKYDFVGIGGQFTKNVPPNNGYQLLPRFVSDVTAQIYPEKIEWAQTVAKGKLPKYFGSNTERGAAYAKMGENDYFFVVSRNGAEHFIRVHDAITGDSVANLPAPKTRVGYFPVNAAASSEDGVLFVSNMTLDASTAPLTIYRWDSLQDTGKVAVSYTAPAAGSRMGDMFSVFGKAKDNSLVIFAGIKDKNTLVKFTTTDSGKTLTPQVITLENTTGGTAINAALASDGTMYVKSYGQSLIHYAADGKYLDSVKAVSSSITNIKYVEMGGKKYIAGYMPSAGQTGIAEAIYLYDVTSAGASNLAAVSPSIGNKSNGNGTGKVDFLQYKYDGKEVNVFYILGSNNGIAAMTYDNQWTLDAYKLAFYGTSKNVLKNPYGPGFIAGVNGYNDLGKYELMTDIVRDDMIYGVVYYFGHKQIVGEPDTVALVVRNAKEDGTPAEILYKTLITTDQLDTTGVGNKIVFDSPVKALANVQVGVEWTKAMNDTIALISDKNNEGDLKNRAWELYENGTYGYFNQPGSNTWGLDADIWIGAYYTEGPGHTVDVKENNNLPTEYALDQNYPNPFNPATTIRFQLKANAKVVLKVFNILGQEVVTLIDRELNAGQQFAKFDASNLSSGVYIYRLEVKGSDGANFSSVKKMMLLK